jgi:hypothetical protein
MNHHKHILKGWPVLWHCFMAIALLPVIAGEISQPAPAPIVPRSIFNQPVLPKDGHDPFFPASMRPYALSVISTAATKDLSSLAIRGKSGTLDRPLIIINDVTFAVGDERDVITPQGRIHIHCLEIIGDLAVIEANGQRHQLRFQIKP